MSNYSHHHALMILSSAIIVVLMFSSAILVSANPRPRLIPCSGTYKQCGTQVGRAVSSEINTRVLQADFLKAQKFIENDERGKNVFSRFQSTVQREFPHLVEEMQGIAVGSGTTYDEIFLANSLDEFGALEAGDGNDPEFHAAPSCTDVLSNVDIENVVHGHNEDNDNSILGLTYMVNATIFTDETHQEIAERFISFAYPGTIAGVYFGWNVHGLVFSDNYIFTNQKEFDVSIPSNIKARSMFRYSTVDEVVINQLKIRGATGYNWNVGSTTPILISDDTVLHHQSQDHLMMMRNFSKKLYKRRMMNIENDPLGGLAMNQIPAKIAGSSMIPNFPHIPKTAELTHWFAHTNMFVNLNTTNEKVDESSVVRRERIFQIVDGNDENVRGVDKIRNILGDTKNKETFPIYRGNGTSSNKDNHIATLASVIYDLVNKKAYVWNENPKETEAQFVFDLW